MIRRTANRLYASEHGNFGMLMAILVVPLGIAVGLAVDYSSALRTRERMQNALDSATLAAIRLPMESSPKARQETLLNVYSADKGEGSPSIESDIKIDGNRAILSTRATYQMPTNFMRLARVDNVDIVVSSQTSVRKSLQDAAFKVINASGIWSKSVTLMGREKGENAYKPLLRMQYDYNGKRKKYALGNLTISKNVKGKWGNVLRKNCQDALQPSDCFDETLADGGDAQIDVSKMDDIYLEMEV